MRNTSTLKGREIVNRIYDYFYEVGARYKEYLASPLLKRIRSGELRRVRNLLEKIPHSQVLELGCGSGFYAPVLTEKAASLTCVDFSPSMLAQIADPKIEKICTDVLNLEIARRFDLVFSFGLTEFIQDSNGLMLVIAQHLKEDGSALVSFPAKNLCGFFYRRHYQKLGIDIKQYSREDIQACIENTNLTVRSEYFVFPMNQVILFKKGRASSVTPEEPSR